MRGDDSGRAIGVADLGQHGAVSLAVPRWQFKRGRSYRSGVAGADPHITPPASRAPAFLQQRRAAPVQRLVAAADRAGVERRLAAVARR